VWTADPTDERLKLVWVVRAPGGGEVGVTVSHQRAGVVRVRLALAADG